MACGGGADSVVSHRSPACLYGLLSDTGGDIHITVVGRNQAPRPGIRRHRVARLAPQDATKLNGLRITTVARTICDLAATESARDTEYAFQEALYREVVTDRSLKAVLEREPCRRGAPVVGALLVDPRLTRSEKERLLLKLIRQAQLPAPRTNVPLHGYKADLYWPQQGLIVEFDGWRAHGHRLAFENNRKRDQIHVANGLRVLRVTDRQLTNEPIAVVARIAQALR